MSYSVEHFLVINETCIEILPVLGAMLTDQPEQKFGIHCSYVENEAKLHIWDFWMDLSP